MTNCPSNGGAQIDLPLNHGPLLAHPCRINFRETTLMDKSANHYEVTSAQESMPIVAMHNHKPDTQLAQPNVSHSKIMLPHHVLKVDQIQPPRMLLYLQHLHAKQLCLL